MFMDNVSIPAIENCLLYPLEKIFTSATINDLDDETIKRLASESSFAQEDRNIEQKEIQRLSSALKICGRYNKPVRGSLGK